MKKSQLTIRHSRGLILLGALAAVAATLACSTNSRPVANAAQPVSLATAATPTSAQGGRMGGTVTPTSLKSGQMTGSVASGPGKALSKPVVYRSRDYGVSFVYPWQYAYYSARTLAKGDAVLRPKSEGQEGQLRLARIEVPKGFYPDTNFDRGYFTLSLNQNLDEEQCQATLQAGEKGKAGSDTINGVEFRWMETDSGGRGSAAKVRNYAAFTNGTCYELEIGVTTSNRDGLAREVDPDQVWQRLEAILRTVEIMPNLQSAPKVASEPAVTD